MFHVKILRCEFSPRASKWTHLLRGGFLRKEVFEGENAGAGEIKLVSQFPLASSVQDRVKDPHDFAPPALRVIPTHRQEKSSSNSSNDDDNGSSTSSMNPALRLWILLASCLAPLVLTQQDDGKQLSSSNTTASGSAAPEQLHLALADPLGKDVYAMSVCWYTLVDAKSEVFWGLEDTLGKVTAGNSTRECRCMRTAGLQYTASGQYGDECPHFSAPVWKDSVISCVHTAEDGI